MTDRIGDEKVKKQIVDELYWDNRVNSADIQVQVAGGSAILHGTVPDYVARGAATEIAVENTDSREVHNKLAVVPERDVTDDEIRKNAECVLMWDSSLADHQLETSVHAGAVELNGVVDSCWKKHKAGELVGNLIGVKAVENKIAIAPSGDFIDTVLASNAMQSIERRFPTQSANVEVAVDNGTAIISGTLPTWSSTKRALAAVEKIAGITKVRNEIVISA